MKTQERLFTTKSIYPLDTGMSSIWLSLLRRVLLIDLLCLSLFRCYRPEAKLMVKGDAGYRKDVGVTISKRSQAKAE